MKVRYLVALVSLVCASASWAREPFIVKDIRVDGIQRTEAGTVFSYLPVKVGDTLDDESKQDVGAVTVVEPGAGREIERPFSGIARDSAGGILLGRRAAV